MSENIPENWQKITLNQLGCFSTSSVDKLIEHNEFPVKLINYMDVYRYNRLDYSIVFMEVTASSIEKIKSQVQEGDIIFTPSSETPDDIGHSAVVEENMVDTLHSYHTVRLRPSEQIPLNVAFSAWFANADYVRNQFARKCAGSTRYTLSLPAFESTYCVLPCNINEQQKIAAILTSIDTAIEKTKALIHKYQQIKVGLMHDLFTRGVMAGGKLRPPREQALELYQETKLGYFPKDWKVIPLGKISDITSGVTLSSKFQPEQRIQVPYLRVANVQDGYLDLTEIKTISVAQKTIDNLVLKVGDVLMNEGGDFDKLGRGTVWQGEIKLCIHQNHVFRVRTNNSILRPYYLAYWSESSFGKKYFILSSKQSTNLASINSTQLNAYPILVPDPTEQVEIENRISAVNCRINSLKKDEDKLNLQKQGLMQDLLTGKVRVKVDQPETANV